jgi:hypothetical protein
MQTKRLVTVTVLTLILQFIGAFISMFIPLTALCMPLYLRKEYHLCHG